MSMNNRDYEEDIEPVIFNTAKEAIEYALSGYWVYPTHCASEEQTFAFSMEVKATDFAQSGLVHFQRR